MSWQALFTTGQSYSTAIYNVQWSTTNCCLTLKSQRFQFLTAVSFVLEYGKKTSEICFIQKQKRLNWIVTLANGTEFSHMTPLKIIHPLTSNSNRTKAQCTIFRIPSNTLGDTENTFYCEHRVITERGFHSSAISTSTVSEVELLLTSAPETCLLTLSRKVIRVQRSLKHTRDPGVHNIDVKCRIQATFSVRPRPRCQMHSCNYIQSYGYIWSLFSSYVEVSFVLWSKRREQVCSCCIAMKVRDEF